jgi:long-subunit fatty acid transport protein
MRRALRLSTLMALSLCATRAAATDVLEFPDNGTEQLSRGGAWVARATNPLATYFNPAGLAGQGTGALANLNLVFTDVCFTRRGPGQVVDGHDALYPADVCDETSVTPLPSVAAAWAVSDRLGIGLSIMPPSLYGNLSFPETVTAENRLGFDVKVPSPQRYLLIEQSGIVLNTTLGVGYEVAKNVRVGGGFTWGFASLEITNANMSLNPSQQADGTYKDPRDGDVLARIQVSDWFIPGFVIGAIYSPLSQLDVGFALQVQEAFDGHGDLTTKANYWSASGLSDNPVVTDSADVGPDLAHFRLPNPLEARIGARFHWPRDPHAPIAAGARRDPIADDVFDLELDFSYTRNSAYDKIMLRFPADRVIEVKGTGGAVPQNNDVPLEIKGDTIGVRLGGEYVLLADRLALRAGGWWEPNVQRPEYLNVAVVASQRIGVAGGVLVRLGPVDVEAGYMHIFFEDVDNGGDGRVRAISGDSSAGNRSPYAINGGKLSQSANIVSVGAAARF